MDFFSLFVVQHNNLGFSGEFPGIPEFSWDLKTMEIFMDFLLWRNFWRLPHQGGNFLMIFSLWVTKFPCFSIFLLRYSLFFDFFHVFLGFPGILQQFSTENYENFEFYANMADMMKLLILRLEKPRVKPGGNR